MGPKNSGKEGVNPQNNKRKYIKLGQSNPSEPPLESEIKVLGAVKLIGADGTREVTPREESEKNYRGQGSRFSYYKADTNHKDHKENVTSGTRSNPTKRQERKSNKPQLKEGRLILGEKSINITTAKKVKPIPTTKPSMDTLDSLLTNIQRMSELRPQTYLSTQGVISTDEDSILGGCSLSSSLDGSSLPRAISTPVKNGSMLSLEGLRLGDSSPNITGLKGLSDYGFYNVSAGSSKQVYRKATKQVYRKATKRALPPASPPSRQREAAVKAKAAKRARRVYEDPAGHFSSDDVNLLE